MTRDSPSIRLVFRNFSISLCTLMMVLASAGCKKSVPIITIVNIGNTNRVMIADQLRIINAHAPKAVVLDFFLMQDSLDRDSLLRLELQKMTNEILVVGLEDYNESVDRWMNLKMSHPKFEANSYGFSNLYADDDSVIASELPMLQAVKNEQFYAISYVAAATSFGIKPEYFNRYDDVIVFDLDVEEKNYNLITSEALTSGHYDTALLNNKIVLMGYIGDSEDYFYLDRRKRKKVNGVEVHAAIINELIERDIRQDQ